jgi:hypothetical protein
MLGDDLTGEILQTVNSGIIPKGENYVVVVLIPKVENVEKITHFCPIILCNVVYKSYKKMLAID